MAPGLFIDDAIIAIEIVAAKMEKATTTSLNGRNEVKWDGYRTVAVNWRPSDAMAGTAGSP